VTVSDILPYQKLQKLRFTDAALADDIKMAAAVNALDAEDESFFLEGRDVIRPADEGNILGVDFAENRQLRRRRRIFYYLDFTGLGHAMFIEPSTQAELNGLPLLTPTLVDEN
jgi:hypothetical protein